MKQFISTEKPVVAVGVVGYPNVGKSSVINALKHGRATVVDQHPGTTKVAQEVQLDKTIVLLDCPGVIPASQEDTHGLILRHAVKVEELVDVVGPVTELLSKVQMDPVLKLYHIAKYQTAD